MVTVELTYQTLSLDSAFQTVKDSSCGAISSFIGTVRDNPTRPVLRLEYEAYTEMAYQVLRQILSQALEKFSLTKVSVFHRLGAVPLSQASIIIVSSSPHRMESLSSTPYILERVKKEVPIWKKELYNDGYSWRSNT